MLALDMKIIQVALIHHETQTLLREPLLKKHPPMALMALSTLVALDVFSH